MSMFKKFGLFMILISVSFMVFGAGDSESPETKAGKPEFNLIAGTQVAVDTPFDKGIMKFKELVEERSGGRITVTNYPASQLGNEPELFQGLMEGTVDLAVVSPGQIAEWAPELALLEMPFVITTEDQRDRVVEGDPMQKLSDLVSEKTDVEIIGVFGGGIRNMFFREPAEDLEDIDGRRFRVQPSPQLTDSYKALGLEPVVTSYPEMFNALQQGVAEGAEMEAIYIEMAGVAAVAPYFLMTGHAITIRPFCMSGNTLDRMPNDLKEIVYEAALEAARYERGIESSEDAASLKRIQDQYSKVRFTEVDVEPMIEAVKPVWMKYAKEWGLEDLIEEIDSMR